MYNNEEKDYVLKKLIEADNHILTFDPADHRNNSLIHILRNDDLLIIISGYGDLQRAQITSKGHAFYANGGYAGKTARLLDHAYNVHEEKKLDRKHMYLSQTIAALLGGAAGAIITWLIMK